MSEVLGGAALLAVSASAAAAILLPAGPRRSAAMLFAVLCFPLLILADQWNSPEISDLRDDPARLVVLAVVAIAACCVLAVAFRRWPVAIPLAIVAALPFRVPLHAGGDTANLLVPLYVVIAAGVLATVLRDLTAAPSKPAEHAGQVARWLPKVLAAVVLLYGLQSLYSPDLSKSIQNVCFFFVPFSLLYVLLSDVEWDRRLLRAVLWVVAVEAVAFVIVGSVEYVSESLFWNDQVIRSNEFHTYFRVNSIFWDPNIYGRYLALAIVIAMSALLWAKEKRDLASLTALVAVLWFGLVPTFSQSSFAALLAGLAVLAALRWSVRWTLAAVGAAIVAGAIAVIFIGGSSSLNPSRLNVDTGGRANLVSGGADLFAQRPVWGYGAGSFPAAYREHIATKKAPVSVSHTEPVTVAAEQGLIGLAAYGALLVCALWTMGGGMFGRAPPPLGRAAALATFVALLVHTMAYAGFYEDPITWVLLAIGASLAGAVVREPT